MPTGHTQKKAHEMRSSASCCGPAHSTLRPERMKLTVSSVASEAPKLSHAHVWKVEREADGRTQYETKIANGSPRNSDARHRCVDSREPRRKAAVARSLTRMSSATRPMAASGHNPPTNSCCRGEPMQSEGMTSSWMSMSTHEKTDVHPV